MSHLIGSGPVSEAAGHCPASAPQQRISVQRAELLIAPGETISAGSVRRFADCLGQTVAPAGYLRRQCGGYEIILTADGLPDDWSDANRRSDLEFIEDLWPEPVGLHLKTSGTRPAASWFAESDRYGLRPLFYGFDSRRRPIVSTRPDIVAALIGTHLSILSLAEHLLIGFNLDDHTPFDGVHRLRPRERLLFDGRSGFRIEQLRIGAGRQVGPANGADWIESITPTIIEAFQRGDALELSGGVDSRLVLAIGLHHGAKPRLAFTLGADADEDVTIARTICRRFGIEHHVLPVEIDTETIVSDGRDFVKRAGFGVNACSYAWLPSAFRRLSRRRTHQIGGGGGECATGFYYCPLDPLCHLTRARRMWVHKRLFHTGVNLSNLLGDLPSRELTETITDAVLNLLQDAPGDWRQRTDEFYLTQRVPNSGGAVLSASACWYQPLQPLLHRPYIEWGRTLAPKERADRLVQMRIIHQLSDELAAIPFSGGRLHASDLSGAARKLRQKASSSVRKISRRLRNRRASADLGARGTAAALAGKEGARRSLRRFVDETGRQIRPEHVERMLASPAHFEHELGVLLTAAWAHDSVDELAGRLHEAETVEPLLRAA
ncbi:MAG: hypothetical protein JSV91_02100 [Phycisphaerales bacterium]|nr:MAG: hypothetical protein JSV91_02100 [Phycisphaerales bacterium]